MAACNCKLVCSIFLGLLSFVYFVVGAAITAVSLILLLIPSLLEDSGQKIAGFSFLVVILFIVAGGLLVLASIFGCVISCKRPVCLIIFFIIVIVTSLALQIAGAVLFREENEKSSLSISKAKEATPKNRFFDLMPGYWQNESDQLLIDERQAYFLCCGYESYRDWNDTRVVPNRKTMDAEKPVLGYIPKSCCSVTSSTCEDITDLYETGCRVRLESAINTYKLVLNASHIAAGVIILIQVLGAVLAIVIAILVRRERGDDRGQFIPMSNQTSL